MEVVEVITSAIFYSSLTGLIIGLYKPWIVLWWMSHQNRKKVIQLYGSTGLISIILKFLIQ